MILLLYKSIHFILKKVKKLQIKHDHKFYDLLIKIFANINGTLAINFGFNTKKIKTCKNTNLNAILYYVKQNIIANLTINWYE